MEQLVTALAGIVVVALVVGFRFWLRSQRRAGKGPASLSRFSGSVHRFDVEIPGKSGVGKTSELDPSSMKQLQLSYSPKIDGDPDPGEVIWTWVPYVEHDGRGKDRPVLILARIDEEFFAACYLSTNPRDGYVTIGTGPWDSQGRESFMNPHRLLKVSASGMRREGAVVPKTQFIRAAKVIHDRYVA